MIECQNSGSEHREHRLIRALLRQPVDCTPVWLMRQAGRYLPEYRQLRATAPDFMAFCKTPELACEATLQPLARFDLDAAIIFSDILTIPDAMGLDVEVVPTQGPIIHNPIGSMRDIERLRMPDVNEALSYVMDAITLTRRELSEKVPLIGFAGSPWTLACYMVEGGGSKTFNRPRSMLYRSPEIMTALLERLTTMSIAYLNAQIAAGAQVVMLFDTWGGLLTPEDYRTFSLKYMSTIARGLNRQKDGKTIPVIFFSKGAAHSLASIADAGCDAVGLDWTVSMEEAKQCVGERVALQGNLDPAVLFAKPEQIQRATQSILQSYGNQVGHVFNLGHGIDPKTPVENVAVMVDAVHQYSMTRERDVV